MAGTPTGGAPNGNDGRGMGPRPDPAPPQRVGPRSGNAQGVTTKILQDWARAGNWGAVRNALRTKFKFNLPEIEYGKSGYNSGGKKVKTALNYYLAGKSRQEFDKWLRNFRANAKTNNPSVGGGFGTSVGSSSASSSDLLNGALGAFPQLSLGDVDIDGINAPATPNWMDFFKQMTKGDKKWMTDPRLLATALTDLEYRAPIAGARKEITEEEAYRQKIPQHVNSAFAPLIEQSTNDVSAQSGLAQALAAARGGTNQGLAATLGAAGGNFATQAANDATAQDANLLNANTSLQLANQGAIRERGLLTSGRDAESRGRTNDLQSQLDVLLKNRGATWGKNLYEATANRTGLYEKAMGLAQAKQGMDLTGALATDQLRQGNISTLQALQNLRQSGVDFNSGQIERALGFATGMQGLDQLLQQGNGMLEPGDKVNASQQVIGMVIDNFIDPTKGTLTRSPQQIMPFLKRQADSIDPKLWRQIKGIVMNQLNALKNRPENPVEAPDPMDAFLQQLLAGQTQ